MDTSFEDVPISKCSLEYRLGLWLHDSKGDYEHMMLGPSFEPDIDPVLDSVPVAVTREPKRLTVTDAVWTMYDDRHGDLTGRRGDCFDSWFLSRYGVGIVCIGSLSQKIEILGRVDKFTVTGIEVKLE